MVHNKTFWRIIRQGRRQEAHERSCASRLVCPSSSYCALKRRHVLSTRPSSYICLWYTFIAYYFEPMNWEHIKQVLLYCEFSIFQRKSFLKIFCCRHIVALMKAAMHWSWRAVRTSWATASYRDMAGAEKLVVMWIPGIWNGWLRHEERWVALRCSSSVVFGVPRFL